MFTKVRHFKLLSQLNPNSFIKTYLSIIIFIITLLSYLRSSTLYLPLRFPNQRTVSISYFPKTWRMICLLFIVIQTDRLVAKSNTKWNLITRSRNIILFLPPLTLHNRSVNFLFLPLPPFLTTIIIFLIYGEIYILYLLI